MRSLLLVGVGVLIGLFVQVTVGQERHVRGLNHVAFAVDDVEAASKFYTEVMGFPEAFAFYRDDGRPVLSYFQVNRETFVELMPTTPDRPPGFVHYGLEVDDVAAEAARLQRAGLEVRPPGLSPRTGSRIAVARTPSGITFELLEFGPESLHRQVMNAWP